MSVALSSPTAFRCDACGHAGTIPEPARSSLQNAAALVRQLDARTRQISAYHLRSFNESYSRAFWSTLVVLVPVVGFGLLAAGWQVVDRGSEAWPDAVTVGGMPVGALLSGIAVLVLLRRGRSRFEERFAAEPSGDATKCHFCGGPLPRGERAVVRCSFCEADNLVSADVLKRIGRRRHIVLDEHATALNRRASRFDILARVSGLAMLVVVPAAAAAASLAAGKIADAVEGTVSAADEAPPHAEIRYVTYTEYENGPACVAQTNGNGRLLVRDFDPQHAKQPPHWEDAVGSERVVAFEASKLVGAFVSYAHRGRPQLGHVVRVYGVKGRSENYAYIEDSHHRAARKEIVGICAEPGHRLPTYGWEIRRR